MGPKRVAKPKLHQKCAELPKGTKLVDKVRKVEIIMDKEIGQGGFGRIYVAHLVDKKEPLIVKIEPQGNGPLFVEQGVFTNILKEDMIDAWRKQKGLDFLGLPHMIANSTHEIDNEKIRFLAMPKYSLSLDDILKKRSTLSINDAVKVAKSILNCYNYMHDQDYVHADLKPGNIMFNSEKDLDCAVLIDFGLAKKKNDSEVEKEDKKRAHNGTPLFTSTDAHRGCNASFRSDIEILAHNMVLWISGTLPWIDLAEEKDLTPVLKAKTDFIDNATTEVPKVIDNKNAAAALAQIYELSKNMEYNAKVDFKKVFKLLDDATKGQKATPVRSTTKKRQTIKSAKEEVDYQPKAKLPASAKAQDSLKQTTSKNKKAIQEPKSKRKIPFESEVEEAESAEEAPPKKQAKPKKAGLESESSEPGSAPKKGKKTTTKSIRKQAEIISEVDEELEEGTKTDDGEASAEPEKESTDEQEEKSEPTNIEQRKKGNAKTKPVAKSKRSPTPVPEVLEEPEKKKEESAKKPKAPAKSKVESTEEPKPVRKGKAVPKSKNEAAGYQAEQNEAEAAHKVQDKRVLRAPRNPAIVESPAEKPKSIKVSNKRGRPVKEEKNEYKTDEEGVQEPKKKKAMANLKKALEEGNVVEQEDEEEEAIDLGKEPEGKENKQEEAKAKVVEEQKPEIPIPGLKNFKKNPRVGLKKTK
uniref:non-specific serine/threonine protein kinase n=1 Tax=Acrobeloides nanus TaxID=290746 RepID=A0A914C8K1_9BILA